MSGDICSVEAEWLTGAIVTKAEQTVRDVHVHVHVP